MKDIATRRKESNDNQREILLLLKGNVDSSGGVDVSNMNDIEQTQWVIKNFKEDLTKQNAKKWKLMDSAMSADKKDSKVSKMNREIKDIKRMIKISKQQLKC